MKHLQRKKPLVSQLAKWLQILAKWSLKITNIYSSDIVKIHNLSWQDAQEQKHDRFYRSRTTWPVILACLSQSSTPSTAVLKNKKHCHSPFTGTNGVLQTLGLYSLLKSMQSQSGSIATSFWKCCAPPRVQFFAWLLQNDRIQCKANLHRRKFLEDNICELCSAEPETASHLLFHCTFASSF